MKREDYSREMGKTLASVAVGKRKADFVVKNSTLLNVYSGELIEGIDVAVKNGRIALVGDADHAIGDGTKVLDVKGKYLAPGFLDGHVHIDDSMGTVTEFARVVLPRGTTGVFMEPHEIANVLGLRGIKLMVEESKRVPLRVYTTLPSCVPATSPKFETSGGQINLDVIKDALQWEETVALGEVMNYPSVVRGDEEVYGMIRETLKAGKVVEGHAPDLSEKELNAYIAAGITSCHESTEKGEALKKLRLGMHLMIREGFASIKNLSELIRILTENEVDSNRVSLVTDDRHPEDLLQEGHMDHVVRRAIEEGVDPIKAIQMASLNTAKHFQVDLDIGGVAPGRFADMIILDDLSTISIREVIANGKIVARNGNLTTEFEPYEYPKYSKNTMRILRKLKPTDFDIKVSTNEDEVEVRVIGVEEGTPKTKNLIESLPVENGFVQQNVGQDIAKVSVVERHKKTGNIGLGLVTGFGFKEGATASTIAHDSHNLLIVGMNDEDMALAANKLAEVGGGIITVRGGKILSLVKLPIAGLMSDQPLERTQKKMQKTLETWDELGCKMKSPLSTTILLTLPVLPELRITDKGLIDTKNRELVDVQIQ